ncbi:Fic family protein [Cellulomonas sp. ACRRI]|uniref:Fic family protein n=1 Tax=Cellulomonas sp. ACRRI TaxID=2918188 RepID=UPI001EF1CA0D|nr:Fic family protein [Cellulomonas sp. ACRRI]MCG7286235.1 Fic family protein [Cellulomonas sp. ACRRI]
MLPVAPSSRPAPGDDPLAPLLDLPGVRDAVDRARTACEELRWHEAFRRRWREVRAEADVRAARASAAVDGARVPLEVLRGVATGGDRVAPAAGAAGPAGVRADDAEPRTAGPVDLRVATGALRATTLAATWRPDLGARSEPALPPLGQLLARLHAAAGARWLPDADLGRVRTEDAPPRDLTGLGAAPGGSEAAARLALLTRTVGTTRAPALVVAAVVHGELLAVRPFAAANGTVARAAARLLLCARGLDPTGAVVPEAGWAAAPVPYLATAARFATGTPEGVAAWVGACADAVVAGAAEARRVADAVLAGRLG